MTNGGPAYPLATPGARVKVNANRGHHASSPRCSPATRPGRNCNDDPQRCNRHGTTFSFAGGALWMGEVQYAVNQGKKAIGLAGRLQARRLVRDRGFCRPALRHRCRSAPSVSLGRSGRRRSAQSSRQLGHLWRRRSDGLARPASAALNLFVRGGVSPSDRNLLSYYVDGGAGFNGLLPGRADDVLTFGVAYAKISARRRRRSTSDTLGDQRSALSDPRLRDRVRS